MRTYNSEESLPKQAIALRVRILRLRISTFFAGRRIRSLRSKEQSNIIPRRWPFVGCLLLCLGAVVSAIVLSVLANTQPQLHNLDGSFASVDKVVILDPNSKDETMLSAGYLYDRPIAVVQTGTDPVLLRIRLEETLLTAAHDENGRVVSVKPMIDPGENWEPRMIEQDAALEILRKNGYCKATDTWDDALELKLPEARMPGGNDGGRLMVFEKKTVIADPDSPIPDISVMRPEDIEAYDLGKTSYDYIGFYYINVGGKQYYQPLHIAVDDDAPRNPTQSPPNITNISYEFYQWDIKESQVHQFGAEQNGPVNLQLGHLRPIAEWTKPEDAWFYDIDGWVYYGQALSSGLMTPLLLQSFSVEPESPLVQNETRYRLGERAQSVSLDLNSVISIWNSNTPLGTLGTSNMSNESLRLVQGILSAAGIKEE